MHKTNRIAIFTAKSGKSETIMSWERTEYCFYIKELDARSHDLFSVL